MANKPKTLAAATIPASNTLCYTVPANTTTIVKNITICNTAASDIQLWVTVNGVSLFSGLVVKAGETISVDTSIVMETGKTIYSQTGTTGLHWIVSGLEVS